MSGPVRPPLTVESLDGSVVGRPITTIKVTNGDLVVSGTVATIDTSGSGGGGSGTVTSIATTSPITGGTITTTGTIGISQADTTTDGFLSSTDWNTFNGKQGAITLTTTGTSGTATLVGSTLNIPNYSNSATIGGTIANTQVAYGSAPDAIQGSANLTFDGTNLSVGGYIKSGGVYDTTGATDLVLKTNGGTNSGTLTLKNGVGGNAIFQPDGTGVFQFNGVSGGNDGAIKLMCSEATHSQTISAAPHASAATYSLVLPTGLPADADNKYLVSDTSGNMSFTTGGSGSVTFPLEGSDGSAAAPTYSFSTESSTGLFLGAAGRMEVSVGGVRQISMFDNRFRFDGGGGTYVVDCDNAASKLSLKSGGTAGEILIPPENEDIEIIPAGTGIVTIGTGTANMEMGLKGNSASAFLRFQYNANTQLSSYSGIYLNANQGGGGNDLVRLNGQITSIGKANTDTQLTTEGTANMVIDTNSGTNSGAITIIDGADGNITLNPNGTGSVGLGNFVFDVDQTVGAGQDDYVLTYDNSAGTISLEAAGGGGGASTLAALTDVSMNITNFTDGLLIQTNSGGSAPTTGTLSGANNNIGIGKDVFSTLTTGDNNVALGNSAGDALDSGGRNVLLGHNSGSALESGQKNVIIGANAMELGGTAATFNVGIGYASMGNVGNSADFNTAIGGSSLSVVSGDNNIALGYTAGDNITSGEANVVIGKADVPSATGDRQLSISSGDGGVTWLTGTSAGVVNIPGSLTVAGSAVGSGVSNVTGLNETISFGGTYNMYDITRQSVWSTGSNATATFGALFSDFTVAWPFTSPKSGTPSSLSIYFGSGTGGGASVAIYSSETDGSPDTLMIEGAMDYSASAVVTDSSLSGTGSLVAGDMYWCAVKRKDSASDTSFTVSASSTRGKIAPSNTLNTAGNCISTTSITASDSFPATFTAASTIQPQNTLLPIVGVQF